MFEHTREKAISCLENETLLIAISPIKLQDAR